MHGSGLAQRGDVGPGVREDSQAGLTSEVGRL